MKKILILIICIFIAIFIAHVFASAGTIENYLGYPIYLSVGSGSTVEEDISLENTNFMEVQLSSVLKLGDSGRGVIPVFHFLPNASVA